MADKIIEARVWQKVDTEANWLANPLPLGAGEQAFVSDKNNFKVNTYNEKKTFAELEYFYKGDVIGNVTLTDDLSLKSDGVYYAQTSGTYGGVVVKEGYYTLLRKKGDVWSLELETKMPMQDLTQINSEITSLKNKNGGQVTISETKNVDGGQVFNFVTNSSINKWNLPLFPDGYYKNMLVVVDDAIWESLENNNTDKPSSTSTKWKKVNISNDVDQTYNPKSSLAQSGKAVNEAVEKSAIPDDWFNYSEDGNVYFDFNLSAGQVLTNGTFNTSTNWLRATVNGINVTNKITIQGLGGFDLSSFQPPYVRVAFYNGGLFLNYIAWIDGVNSLEVAVPSNATKMEIQVAGGNGVGLNLSTSQYLQKLKVFRVVGDDNPKESIKVEYVKDAVTLGDLDNIKIKDKYLHFSFDDVVLSLKDLTTNQATYTSIFNNVFFAELKRLHDTYKAVFSLYCFTETTGWNISNFPTKYAQEIKDNSDWLKFGFHTKNSSTNYQNASATVIKTDYDYFINEFYSKTGSINSIDRVVRLQNFLGNLDAVKAIRDTNCGILGLLTADDNRSSYYLNTEQVSYINSHDSFLDSANYLKFFKTEQRLEGVSNITTYLSNFLTPSFANQSKELILFTHEIELYATAGGSLNNTMKSKMENCFSWAKNNNYSFRFPTIN